MRRIIRLIQHHSLTSDSKTVSWDAIRRWHTGQNPQSPYGFIRPALPDIGYHLGLERIGSHIEILWGRSWRQPGAHAIGANGDSLGICWVGNFTDAPPSDVMMEAGAMLNADLCAVFELRPEVAILGHHDVDERRLCPGAAFPLERLRDMVAGRPR